MRATEDGRTSKRTILDATESFEGIVPVAAAVAAGGVGEVAGSAVSTKMPSRSNKFLRMVGKTTPGQ